MSYHVIDISSEGAVLSVKNRQLVCRQKNGETRQLPLEDIGAVIVNSFSVLMHNSFLSAAADAKVAVVICERFRPKSVVLPVQRGGDTMLTRAQIGVSARFADAIWMKTIDAKVSNQFDLLTNLYGGSPRLDAFRVAMKRSDQFKEGNCARVYWDLLSERLGMRDFRRQREGGGFNDLLNYGYGVLVTRVLQKLLAHGLDPMYGVGHAVRERAMPLAYDVMEPFRAAFDCEMLKWVQGQRDDADAFLVNEQFKRMVHGILKRRHPHREAKAVPLEAIIDEVIRSLKRAFLTGKTTEYRPWIRRSSRWDG